MARIKDIEVFKRDNLLLEFFKAHKGKANIVTSKDVKKFLEDNGYKTTSVYNAIVKIMYERNAPICFSNGKGYYWAESRRASLKEHIDHLKNFIIG